MFLSQVMVLILPIQGQHLHTEFSGPKVVQVSDVNIISTPDRLGTRRSHKYNESLPLSVLSVDPLERS